MTFEANSTDDLPHSVQVYSDITAGTFSVTTGFELATHARIQSGIQAIVPKL